MSDAIYTGRPVRFNNKVKLAEAPPGVEGEGFFLTKLSDVVGLGRKNSLWPLPFATSCCGIEFMATMASKYDIARFGAEAMRFSPRQADLMIVAGRVTIKILPVLQHIYQQMTEPKWVIS